MKDKDINKLVDETLNSLDNIQKADAVHLSADKIMSGILIKKNNPAMLSLNFMLKAAAVILIAFSLNIFTWLHVTIVQKKAEKHDYSRSIESVKSMFENNDDKTIN